MRIPGSQSEPKKRKPVVLMIHGLEADSSSWVINSPDRSPAFILVRAGYDVWLGSNRGSLYSRGHQSFNSSDIKDMPQYYDFDFEDMGLKDIPAFTDFIIKTTGQKKIAYVGHSLGTTQFFAGLSLMPDYQFVHGFESCSQN